VTEPTDAQNSPFPTEPPTVDAPGATTDTAVATADAGATGENGAAKNQKMSKRRSTAVWVIVVATTLIAVIASLNVWVNRQALNTDAWVKASDKMLQNDEVRDALAVFLVQQLYDNVDIAGQFEEWLPEDFKKLSGVLSGALRTPATEGVRRLLETPQAQQAWRSANRVAHQTAVRILEDKTRYSSTADGVITLELGDLVKDLGEQLGLPSSLLDRIPEDAGQITLLKSDQIKTAQDAVRIIRLMSSLLLILVVGLYAFAVWLARGDARRKTLRNIGWAITLGGLFLLTARNVLVDYVVGQVGDQQYRGAARALAMIASALLAQLAMAGIVYGLLIACYAILLGPSRIMTAVRRAIAPVMNVKPAFLWGATVALFVLLVVWSPTPAFASLLMLLVLTTLLFAGMEVLRRQSNAEFPDRDLAGLGLAIRTHSSNAWESMDNTWKNTRARHVANTAARAAAAEAAAATAAAQTSSPSTGGMAPGGGGGAGGTATGIAGELTSLRDLHQSGAITDDEYAAAKAQVLGPKS